MQIRMSEGLPDPSKLIRGVCRNQGRKNFEVNFQGKNEIFEKSPLFDELDSDKEEEMSELGTEMTLNQINNNYGIFASDKKYEISKEIFKTENSHRRKKSKNLIREKSVEFEGYNPKKFLEMEEKAKKKLIIEMRLILAKNAPKERMKILEGLENRLLGFSNLGKEIDFVMKELRNKEKLYAVVGKLKNLEKNELREKNG